MDIARAFTFVFDEDRYVEKLAIGTGLVLASFLLSFVLVGFLGFFILAGYSVRLLRNVQAKKTQVLPEWNDWGGDLGRGFKLMAIGFIWSLPALILAIPMVIGGMMTGGNEVAQIFGAGLLICVGLLAFAYALFVVLITPAYTIAFAQDERIASGLQLTEIWRWTRDNIGQVIVVGIVVVLGSMAISVLASVVGSVLCFVGLIVTVPLSVLAISLFQYHLYGQLAREHPLGSGFQYDAAGPIVDSASTVDAAAAAAREEAVDEQAADLSATIDAAADAVEDAFDDVADEDKDGGGAAA
jgi:hypothetical protein